MKYLYKTWVGVFKLFSNIFKAEIFVDRLVFVALTDAVWSVVIRAREGLQKNLLKLNECFTCVSVHVLLLKRRQAAPWCCSGSSWRGRMRWRCFSGPPTGRRVAARQTSSASGRLLSLKQLQNVPQIIMFDARGKNDQKRQRNVTTRSEKRKLI